MSLDEYKKSIEKYKDTYLNMYGHQPSEKLIKSHCDLHGIPWPLPREEESENKPGNQMNCKSCGKALLIESQKFCCWCGAEFKV